MSDQTSALNAMRMLDLLLEFFGNGEHWLQGAFRQGRERRCLVDAIGYLRRKHRITDDATGWYIYEVIRPQEYRPLALSAKSPWRECQLRDRLMTFNDARCKSFDEFRAVILKARALAQRGVDPFAAAKAADFENRQAAAARERQLLAELERERQQRHAAGDTRETFILPPRAPESHAPVTLAVDTQREAARSTADAEQKRLAAVAARWDLITQLQFERKSSAVRRITRHTYILCPRAPEPYAEPLRLAA